MPSPPSPPVAVVMSTHSLSQQRVPMPMAGYRGLFYAPPPADLHSSPTDELLPPPPPPMPMQTAVPVGATQKGGVHLPPPPPPNGPPPCTLSARVNGNPSNGPNASTPTPSQPEDQSTILPTSPPRTPPPPSPTPPPSKTDDELKAELEAEGRKTAVDASAMAATVGYEEQWRAYAFVDEFDAVSSTSRVRKRKPKPKSDGEGETDTPIFTRLHPLDLPRPPHPPHSPNSPHSLLHSLLHPLLPTPSPAHRVA